MLWSMVSNKQTDRDGERERETDLVCKCDAAILRSLYCTGILHSAKSTIFPPCATWKSYNAVFFTTPCCIQHQHIKTHIIVA